MAGRLIHILPEQVASQIAAGEVVERPASAIKELVENSLDAGAHRIDIAIERGGCARIAVSDDGCGMSHEDAVVSLRRHATSKISSAADLAAIRTLGFRGEALASTASVSRMRLRTRRPADGAGIEITAIAGDVEGTGECAIAPGTQIEVRDLFFNTPARLKFLKTVPTEQGAVAAAIQRLALMNYQVAFSLSADGRTLFELPRAASTRERVRQILGPRLAAQMLAFEAVGNAIRVHGLATMSQESFASPRLVFTFVNGRSVRDKLLTRAVAQAYHGLLPRGRHPAIVLAVEVRHDEVDVNVHPMKTEVRFRNSGAVFETAYRALRNRLSDQTAEGAPQPSPQVMAPVPQPGAPAAAPGQPVHAAAASQSENYRAAVLRLIPDAPVVPVTQRPLGLGFTRNDDSPAVTPPSVPTYSALRVMGQLFAGYIALESDEGMLLVDQHAAHERVTFEKLRAQLRDGGIQTQAMLAPVTIELNPARAAQIQAAVPHLRAMGFEIEAFGATALLLKGTPAVFGAEGGARLLSDMIESLGESGWRLNGQSAFEELLKQLACHGSVRVGRALEIAEIHGLLAELDRTEFKTNCPHGRPVHIQFSRGQIERMFRR
ncbi:MAG: DNA mismatch repair endonuclease MutL [Deltaproteobacteria bacterium]|jgi:DNA mismatch repair protein MutL|nr:DNA mismatch repair endonuclease MutL [Deltaproteobacteria bacterium]